MRNLEGWSRKSIVCKSRNPGMTRLRFTQGTKLLVLFGDSMSPDNTDGGGSSQGNECLPRRAVRGRCPWCGRDVATKNRFRADWTLRRKFA